MATYDAAADIIDTAIWPQGSTEPIRNVTTAEKMSRSDNAASRWFAANKQTESMSYVIMGARYVYDRRSVWSGGDKKCE